MTVGLSIKDKASLGVLHVPSSKAFWKNQKLLIHGYSAPSLSEPLWGRGKTMCYRQVLIQRVYKHSEEEISK